MIIHGRLDDYNVDEHRNPVAEDTQQRYHIHLATRASNGAECLLQIPNDPTRNPLIDRTAFILRTLRERSDELEQKYAKEHPGNPPLNYHFGLPELVESIAPNGPGGRRANVLAFHHIAHVDRLKPAAVTIEVDRVRVDIRTSAWIMGKLLKTLVLTHVACGIQVGCLNTSNLLLEFDEHYPIIFDWSDAFVHPAGVPLEEARSEIMQIAHTVIDLLGGDHRRRFVPREGNEDDGFTTYTNLLYLIADGTFDSASDAHDRFYTCIRRQLGWKGFHTFKPLPRS